MRWNLFRSRGPGPRPPFRPQLESLESRRVPSLTGFIGSISHAISHAAAPVEHVVQQVAAPVDHVVQNTFAPVEHVVQHAAAPVEHAVQHVAAPVQHAIQHAAAPVEHVVQHTVAPVEHAVQHAAAPVEHAAAPVQQAVQHVEHALTQAVQQGPIDRSSIKLGDPPHATPVSPAGKLHLPLPGPGEFPGGIHRPRPGGFPGGWINLPEPGPSGLPGGVDLPRPGGIDLPLPGPDLPGPDLPGGIHLPLPGPPLPGGVDLPRPGGLPGGIDLLLPGPDLPGGIHQPRPSPGGSPGGIDLPLPGPDLPGGIHLPLPGPDLPGGIHRPRPGDLPGGGLDFPGLRGGLVLKNEQGTNPPEKPGQGQGQDEGPQPGDSQPTGIDEKTDPTDTKVVVDAKRHPESARHLEEAGATGRRLTVNRPGAAKNREDALRGRNKVPNHDLDEAPPAVLRKPGDPVSVRPIPSADNRGAGASIGNQLRKVPDGGQVIIEIVKLRG
jgi:hypothetical protein